jgi:hypothetical protein
MEALVHVETAFCNFTIEVGFNSRHCLGLVRVIAVREGCGAPHGTTQSLVTHEVIELTKHSHVMT